MANYVCTSIVNVRYVDLRSLLPAESARISIREHYNSYKPNIIPNAPNRPLRVGCTVMDFVDTEVTADFQYDRGCGGAPERRWARKTLEITIGQWGQIVYNGRFTGEDFWWYEKHVVNVGQFENISSGVFTRCAPN